MYCVVLTCLEAKYMTRNGMILLYGSHPNYKVIYYLKVNSERLKRHTITLRLTPKI